ncbi:hypothetical protein C8Q79DRAFT_737347 [Trametes meyenii]|nr:hypothetical protein C8Q79DRAFT_737347 [Trametes meyenii]
MQEATAAPDSLSSTRVLARAIVASLSCWPPLRPLASAGGHGVGRRGRALDRDSCLERAQACLALQASLPRTRWCWAVKTLSSCIHTRRCGLRICFRAPGASPVDSHCIPRGCHRERIPRLDRPTSIGISPLPAYDAQLLRTAPRARISARPVDLAWVPPTPFTRAFHFTAFEKTFVEQLHESLPYRRPDRSTPQALCFPGRNLVYVHRADSMQTRRERVNSGRT